MTLNLWLSDVTWGVFHGNYVFFLIISHRRNTLHLIFRNKHISTAISACYINLKNSLHFILTYSINTYHMWCCSTKIVIDRRYNEEIKELSIWTSMVLITMIIYICWATPISQKSLCAVCMCVLCGQQNK